MSTVLVRAEYSPAWHPVFAGREIPGNLNSPMILRTQCWRCSLIFAEPTDHMCEGSPYNTLADDGCGGSE